MPIAPLPVTMTKAFASRRFDSPILRWKEIGKPRRLLYPCSGPNSHSATAGHSGSNRSEKSRSGENTVGPMGEMDVFFTTCRQAFEHGTRIAVLLFVGLLPANGAWAQEAATQQRLLMVEEQLRQRGIAQPEVLDAMNVVPRHLFVPEELKNEAYSDAPLPIPLGETISQPYLSARMIELLDLDQNDRVLEVGTGSGYDAALLSHIAREVFTIEIDEELALTARDRLADLGYENVHVRQGDGHKGLPDEAPFDAIILTTAPEEVPQGLLDQLKINGTMVVPVGGVFQDLMVIRKTETGQQKRFMMPIRLSPMRELPPK